MVTDKESYLREHLTFWDRLTIEEQQQLVKNTNEITFEKGSSIYRSHGECIGILLIISGSLRTYLLSEQGKEVTLYRLTDGDICVLSASCLFKNITFDVFIDAETDVELLLVNASEYEQLMNSNVYVENFTYKISMERFSDVMWSMEQILFMSFDQRLAAFLIDESSRQRSDKILLTHSQIAKYIGSAREVVSRMLKYFEEENLVALSRGGIILLDKDKLKEIIS